MYPGSHSSIRFEKLREGIVDFEKIQLLRTRAASSTDGAVKQLLTELGQELGAMAADREFDEARLRDTLARERGRSRR